VSTITIHKLMKAMHFFHGFAFPHCNDKLAKVSVLNGGDAFTLFVVLCAQQGDSHGGGCSCPLSPNYNC